MLGLSFSNLLPSVVLLFNDLFYPGKLGELALDTTPSCTAAGFLLQIGSGECPALRCCSCGIQGYEISEESNRTARNSGICRLYCFITAPIFVGY